MHADKHVDMFPGRETTGVSPAFDYEANLLKELDLLIVRVEGSDWECIQATQGEGGGWWGYFLNIR